MIQALNILYIHVANSSNHHRDNGRGVRIGAKLQYLHQITHAWPENQERPAVLATPLYPLYPLEVDPPVFKSTFLL